MFVVALTGGIGSGKTVVSDHFAGIGVPVIDTDVIAREVVQPGKPTLAKLVEHFGQNILTADGELDRDQMRKVAFSDKDNKAALDNITHPAIREETISQIGAVRYPYCVVVIPLLHASSAFAQLAQRILVVSAETETRIERVMQRNGLSRDQVKRIIASQPSEEERRDMADDIIDNNGSIADAQNCAEQLHQQYLLFSLNQPLT